MTEPIMSDEARAALDGDPNIVVWATVDQGKFLMVVTRNPAELGVTATLRVSLKETDEELLNEQVGLAFGAVFGPDVDDLHEWQVKTITAIDKWIEAHP